MITFSLGGEGYLNFIGNEFGHPEWVDFPREGNNWSYHHARRLWSLVDDPLLRYGQLGAWDQAMISLGTKHQILAASPARQLYLDPDKMILAYERANLIFVFSFHPSHSFTDFHFRVPEAGNYKIILHSDEKDYGGFERLDERVTYSTDEHQCLTLYVPSRVMMVLRKVTG